MPQLHRLVARLAAVAALGVTAEAALAQERQLPRRPRRARHQRRDSHDGRHEPRRESVRVLDDRIVAVGDGRLGATRCTQVIDVRGRTVVPGLIDNHNHVVLLGLRPGHDTRLESAASIDDVLALLKARAAALPAGEWITSIGGFDTNQFVPAPGAPRFPTLAELDSVTPQHPVYIQQSFAGPSVTNTLGKRIPGRQRRGGRGRRRTGGRLPDAQPDDASAIRAAQAANARGPKARHARRAALRRELRDYDATSTKAASRPRARPPDGAAHFDRYRGYDALLALNAEGKLLNRIRVNFLHMETDPATPELAARLANVFPDFGGDLLKIVGIGEFTAGASPIIAEPNDAWVNGTRRVAEAGWRNENHSLTPGDFKVIIDDWEQTARDVPRLRDLRWVVAHVPFITRDYADKLKALGGGVSVLGGWRYIAAPRNRTGRRFGC